METLNFHSQALRLLLGKYHNKNIIRNRSHLSGSLATVTLKKLLRSLRKLLIDNVIAIFRPYVS